MQALRMERPNIDLQMCASNRAVNALTKLWRSKRGVRLSVERATQRIRNP
jgi:hypothetical protein